MMLNQHRSELDSDNHDEFTEDGGREGTRELPGPSRRLTTLNPPKVSTLSKRRRISEDSTSKKPKGKGLRSSGKLVQLLNMPLEVFFEIISQLSPLDILQLSRVSKHFHSTFASRSSRHIWIAAKKNVPDIPECPPDMSEPQYASLLFERVCMACWKSRAHKVDFSLRVRFCGPCFKENVQTGVMIMKRGWKAPRDVWDVPFNAAMSLLPRSITEITGPPASSFDPKENNRWHYFYVPEVDTVLRRYAEFRVKPDGLKLFMEQKREIASQIMSHASLLNQWAHHTRLNKVDEDRERSRKRETSIISKLQELGYDQDDIKNQSGDNRWVALAKRPRDLTPRIWKAIRPKLEALVAEEVARASGRRSYLRKAEFAAVWSKYVLDAPPEDRDLMPKFSDACNLSSLKSMLAEDDWRISPSEERLLAINDALIADIAEYKWRIQAALVKALLANRSVIQDGVECTEPHSNTVDQNADLSLLKRAHTFLRCNRCRTYLPYPQIFSHHHIRSTSSFTPWELSEMCPPAEVKCTAILLLHKLGFPDDTSHVTMAELGEQLMCLCGYPTRMSFVALVQHFFEENAEYKRLEGRRGLVWDFEGNLTEYLVNQHNLTDDQPRVACIPSEDASNFSLV